LGEGEEERLARWYVGEEEMPLIKELGAVRVADETKRCACVSGVSTRHRGEPMKRSGARWWCGVDVGVL
jgi:hypothetical protein